MECIWPAGPAAGHLIVGYLGSPFPLLPLGELPVISVDGDGIEPRPRTFTAESLLPLGTKA